MDVSNLPKVVAWRCTGRESNPPPLGHVSDMLTSTPPSHPSLVGGVEISLGVGKIQMHRDIVYSNSYNITVWMLKRSFSFLPKIHLHLFLPVH